MPLLLPWKRTDCGPGLADGLPGKCLTEAGDFLVYDISRYSVLLVRTESGQLRGYHNGCLHRGRALKSGRGETGRSAAPTTDFAGIWMVHSRKRSAVRNSRGRHWRACHCRRCRLPFGVAGYLSTWICKPRISALRRLAGQPFWALAMSSAMYRCTWRRSCVAAPESASRPSSSPTTLSRHPQILSFTGGDNSQYGVFGPH